MGRPPIKQEEFLDRAIKKHGDKYDYSLAEYKSSFGYVLILCKQCKTTFKQMAFSHMAGYGCKKCAHKKTGEKSFEKAKDKFLEKAILRHGNKYDLSLVEYNGRQEKIKVSCTLHPSVFEIIAGNFLLSDGGCKICAIANSTNHSKIRSINAAKNFIEKCIKKHGDNLDYSKTNYTLSTNRITVTCKKHGDFEQYPLDHLKGGGCPSCSVSGFDKKKPAILYYVKIENESGVFYKIGITNLSIKARFNKHKDNMTILSAEPFKNGLDAYNKEKVILERYKKHKYIGENVIRDGNTELFVIDVLELDR